MRVLSHLPLRTWEVNTEGIAPMNSPGRLFLGASLNLPALTLCTGSISFGESVIDHRAHLTGSVSGHAPVDGLRTLESRPELVLKVSRGMSEP